MSEGGLVVSFIDKSNVLWTWSLETLLAPMDDTVRTRERRRIEAVVHKVTYAK
jgi:polo-like kinase 1